MMIGVVVVVRLGSKPILRFEYLFRFLYADADSQVFHNFLDLFLLKHRFAV